MSQVQDSKKEVEAERRSRKSGNEREAKSEQEKEEFEDDEGLEEEMAEMLQDEYGEVDSEILEIVEDMENGKKDDDSQKKETLEENSDLRTCPECGLDALFIDCECSECGHLMGKTKKKKPNPEDSDTGDFDGYNTDEDE